MLLRLQNSFASMTEGIRQQERTANNLANANTVGYKRDRMFTEVLNEYLDAEEAPRSARSTVQFADHAAGPLEETGNPLDVALGGEGFFVVADEAGAPRYTRAGRFTLDAEGTLRTPDGLTVEGEGGPIRLPAGGGPVDVQPDGTILAGGQPAGRLRVVTFADPGALPRAEGAAFFAGGQEPVDAPSPEVLQGFVEGSNADPVREMTQMVTHHRLFESQQKLLQSQDSVLGQVVRDLGKF